MRSAAEMIVMVSGGFDPIHIGHVRLILSASAYGSVIVALNSDAWLKRKKGYVFMPWEDRAEILQAICGVRAVTAVEDSDGTVCEALRRLKPVYFANGGDRVGPDSAEHRLCEELGIKELFGIGGEKACSSSRLVEAVIDHHSHAL